MEQELLKEILRAQIYHVARRTPLERARQLSEEVDNEIYIKREDLQPIFSFKIRGAANKIASLPPSARARGVICASAGNHGQGVALSAQQLGMPAWVVMPTTTPAIKVRAVAAYGAEVILAGDHYTEAWDHCQSLVTRLGAELVHPFDDLLVMAGQGTIGKEILEDCPRAAYIFVPVGGGGLLAGLASYVKYLAPHVQVIGVEPFDSDAMTRSQEAGERIVLERIGAFADGVAVKQVGSLTFELARRHVDGYMRVSTDQICSAIQDIYRETRTIVEPAGALSWAGAKAYLRQHGIRNANVVTINSGANMNFQRLHFVAERALTGAGLESLFAVRLPERRGALKEFCRLITPGRSITEFNYRKSGSEEAHIFLGISTPQPQDRQELHELLRRCEYWFCDLTDNELAKEHVRHLVGGYAPGQTQEELYSFNFPERAGALSVFLALMSERWNISLFHYRSHGSDYGRVLIAFEVPAWEKIEFQAHLAQVGYASINESSNPAYELFLKARHRD